MHITFATIAMTISELEIRVKLLGDTKKILNQFTLVTLKDFRQQKTIRVMPVIVVTNTSQKKQLI